jgi:hypothetical protein
MKIHEISGHEMAGGTRGETPHSKTKVENIRYWQVTGRSLIIKREHCI